jgi:hypothetical protein
MSFLSPSKLNRSLIQGARSIVRNSYLIVWEIVVCALLIVSACGQNSTPQSKRPATSAPSTADPSSTSLLYRTTFSTSTTYTQAHELLTRLGLSVSQWDCAPRSERAGKILSAAAVLLTTPPPSQDTPELEAFIIQDARPDRVLCLSTMISLCIPWAYPFQIRKETVKQETVTPPISYRDGKEKEPL